MHLLNILRLLGSQKWRAGGQSYRFYSYVSELFQLVSYAKLKYTAESGGINLGLRKLFLPAFFELTILHLLNILDLLGSQKWRAGGQSYRFYSDVSELFQLVSYAKLKYTAESGGINLGPRKLFFPAFC